MTHKFLIPTLYRPRLVQPPLPWTLSADMHALVTRTCKPQCFLTSPFIFTAPFFRS